MQTSVQIYSLCRSELSNSRRLLTRSEHSSVTSFSSSHSFVDLCYRRIYIYHRYKWFPAVLFVHPYTVLVLCPCSTLLYQFFLYFLSPMPLKQTFPFASLLLQLWWSPGLWKEFRSLYNRNPVVCSFIEALTEITNEIFIRPLRHIFW